MTRPSVRASVQHGYTVTECHGEKAKGTGNQCHQPIKTKRKKASAQTGQKTLAGQREHYTQNPRRTAEGQERGRQVLTAKDNVITKLAFANKRNVEKQAAAKGKAASADEVGAPSTTMGGLPLTVDGFQDLRLHGQRMALGPPPPAALSTLLATPFSRQHARHASGHRPYFDLHATRRSRRFRHTTAPTNYRFGQSAAPRYLNMPRHPRRLLRTRLLLCATKPDLQRSAHGPPFLPAGHYL